MLQNSLSSICPQPHKLTLMRCQINSKAVVWVLDQLFLFFCWRNFLPAEGSFLPEEVFFTKKSDRCQSKKGVGTQSYTWTPMVREHTEAERIYCCERQFPDLSFPCPALAVWSFPLTPALVLFWSSIELIQVPNTADNSLLSRKCSASSASWIGSAQRQVSTRNRGSKAKKGILWPGWFEPSF